MKSSVFVTHSSAVDKTVCQTMIFMFPLCMKVVMLYGVLLLELFVLEMLI